jgi:L-fucose isomerase-like protein
MGSIKVLPVLVCRKGQVPEQFLSETMETLHKNLNIETEILGGVTINDEDDLALFDVHAKDADAILLYKPHLGLGKCIAEIVKYGLPIILFNDEGIVNNPLDALEYVYTRNNVWVAVDYQDVNNYLEVISVKEKLRRTKILVLNDDYPHWEQFLSRVHGGREAIKKKFGIELGYVQSEDVVKQWRNIDDTLVKALAEKWISEAEKIVEPTRNDVDAVARLYILMKSLLNEKNAHAITMAYGDNPLPVPCFAYTNLRDEGIPAACEADIISLLSMVILHYVAKKPCFMGNTFIDTKDDTLILSHCVCPRKMEGYNANAAPYILRRYHNKNFAGSLTAFVKMKIGQEVTICRLSGDFKNMIVANGVLLDCKEMDSEMYCRVTAKVKIKNPREFVHKTSGNHHVMVYGDYREQLKKLNSLLDINTIEM